MDIARNWRLKKQRYTLDKESQTEGVMAVLTPLNGNGHSPQKAHSTVRSQAVKGEVYSFTKIYDAPAGFEEFAPYTIAMIRLEDGRLVTAQITDLGETKAEIGMPVEMVTRKLRDATDERGMLVYGYKFRPVVK